MVPVSKVGSNQNMFAVATLLHGVAAVMVRSDYKKQRSFGPEGSFDAGPLLAWGSENTSNTAFSNTTSSNTSFSNTTPSNTAFCNTTSSNTTLEVEQIDEDELFKNVMKTPLMSAVEKNEIDVVEILLEMETIGVDDIDVNMNEPNDEGWTPLTLAAYLGNLEIMDILLRQKGINADSKDGRGRTPLIAAVDGKQVEIMSWLMSLTNVDIGLNEPSKACGSGYTPLTLAAYKGEWDMMQLLFAQDGITPSTQDGQGATCLMAAIEGNATTIVQNLLDLDQEIGLEQNDNYGWSPLTRAANLGHIDIMDMLIDQGEADVARKDGEGRTAICAAVLGNQLDIVKCLAGYAEEEDIDIGWNDVEDDGWTPATLAAHLGQWEIMEVLFEQENISPESVDRDYRTPMLAAVQANRIEVVEKLIEMGETDETVDIGLHTHCIQGFIPLTLAAAHGHKEILEILFEQPHMTLSTKDGLGRTALDAAREADQPHIVKFIKQKMNLATRELLENDIQFSSSEPLVTAH